MFIIPENERKPRVSLMFSRDAKIEHWLNMNEMVLICL